MGYGKVSGKKAIPRPKKSKKPPKPSKPPKMPPKVPGVGKGAAT